VSPAAIEVVEYDEAWPQVAETARAELVGRLPGLFAAIEHIGSTSVPGLAAKPIIDLMAAAADLDRVVGHDESLAELGYLRLDGGMPGRLFYRCGQHGLGYHLHVVPGTAGRPGTSGCSATTCAVIPPMFSATRS
jgi:GrpB-like predicted nucleotidyltransferase (UPF0157 family)